MTAPVLRPLAALQAALAAEQATIYGYGVVGAWLTGADRDRALDALAVHLVRRDQLSALVTAAGGAPVVALPSYQLPIVVDSATTARELAAHLEQGCAGATWDLVAASAANSTTRMSAIGWLADAAARAGHWGAAQALPGQPAAT